MSMPVYLPRSTLCEPQFPPLPGLCDRTSVGELQIVSVLLTGGSLRLLLQLLYTMRRHLL